MISISLSPFLNTFSPFSNIRRVPMNIEDFPADWSELPGDLLGKIVDTFISSFCLSDYVRIWAVCDQWRSFLIQTYEHIKLPSQLPLLLIPSDLQHQEQLDTEISEFKRDAMVQDYYDPSHLWLDQDHHQRYKSMRSFYNLTEKKVYDFQLPVPYYKNCRGSSHGWLITVEHDENCSIRLLNPFRSSNFEFQLPPLNTFGWKPYMMIRTYLLKKAVLSASPSSNPTDFVVMVIYGTKRLGFCRAGDTTWTCLPVYTADDVVYDDGYFFAVLKNGLVLAYEVASLHQGSKPELIILAEAPNGTITSDRHYLLYSSGDLLQVHKHHLRNDAFKVYKMLEYNDWVELETLDGRILFLGDNTSMSLSASDFPGLKPDCIYFTDDNPISSLNPYYGLPNMGIFNVAEGTCEAHFQTESKVMMPIPIWIQPSL